MVDMNDELAKRHAVCDESDLGPIEEADEAEKRALAVAREAIDTARANMARSVYSAMNEAYWKIGKEISKATGERAGYGRHLMDYMSRNLTAEYGRGFSVANLRNMRQFYRAFPIRYTLSSELSWSHYKHIMRVEDPEARDFYVRECAASHWGVRQLKRQIDTNLYERLLHTQEAKAIADASNPERAAIVLKDAGGLDGKGRDLAMSPFKDPYVFEFADIPSRSHVLETDLESILIDSLEDFLLELGRGFSFVKRQRRLSDDGEDWWVDLVFYNYYLRRFVLFDLKTGKLDSRDVGQMDFYLHFFDDKYKLPEDGPSIGILLCSEKDETVARYSALARNENLRAAQYFTYLPTEEELETVLRKNRAEFEERLARELPQQAEDDAAEQQRLPEDAEGGDGR